MQLVIATVLTTVSIALILIATSRGRDFHCDADAAPSE